MRACKICIMKFGLKGSEIESKTKTFETDEDLFEHMENVHGIPVMRKDESEEDCQKRCEAKGIVSDRSRCQCVECKMLRKELVEVK